ncbi:MAG: hypothetical protein HFI76_14370 [Lachnospiraceae bacterium]|nr:hypothetical protein [Lachnospiraceae bacterium]
MMGGRQGKVERNSRNWSAAFSGFEIKNFYKVKICRPIAAVAIHFSLAEHLVSGTNCSKQLDGVTKML